MGQKSGSVCAGGPAPWDLKELFKWLTLHCPSSTLFNPLSYQVVPVWVWVSTINISNAPRAYPTSTGTSRQRTFVVAEELVLMKTELIILIGEKQRRTAHLCLLWRLGRLGPKVSFSRHQDGETEHDDKSSLISDLLYKTITRISLVT